MFNDDTDYISLPDLSKSKQYSLEFLLQAAVSGKLKAFKMGDDWFTTIDWFEQYNGQLKNDLDGEIGGVADEESGWVSFVPNTISRLSLVPHALVIIFVFAILSLSLSWLVLYPDGHKFALSDIKKGELIFKYGEIIGIATKEIMKGDWIHTHNVKSAYLERGREK